MRNTLVEDFILSQLQSEEEFINQRSSNSQNVYSRKFQITVEKHLPQTLTCRLAQLGLSPTSFTWLEKNMHNAKQTFEINCHFSLTKLMVSHYLLRSTVANQITFDQRDSTSILKFERPMDRCYQALVSKLETLVLSLLLN